MVEMDEKSLKFTSDHRNQSYGNLTNRDKDKGYKPR
jgi:hypothetical protein